MLFDIADIKLRQKQKRQTVWVKVTIKTLGQHGGSRIMCDLLCSFPVVIGHHGAAAGRIAASQRQDPCFDPGPLARVSVCVRFHIVSSHCPKTWQ